MFQVRQKKEISFNIIFFETIEPCQWSLFYNRLSLSKELMDGTAACLPIVRTPERRQSPEVEAHSEGADTPRSKNFHSLFLERVDRLLQREKSEGKRATYWTAEEYNKIKVVLKSGPIPSEKKTYMYRKSYVLKNDEVYKKNEVGEDLRLVHLGEAWRVLNEVHESAGHKGLEAYLKRLAELRIFGLPSDIIEHFWNTCLHSIENRNTLQLRQPKSSCGKTAYAIRPRSFGISWAVDLEDMTSQMDRTSCPPYK